MPHNELLLKCAVSLQTVSYKMAASVLQLYHSCVE